MRVSCPCCHRIETWEQETRRTVVEGGQRVAKPNPSIAAFRTLQEAQHDPTTHVVAVCPHCEQPMLAESSEAPPIHWPLTLQDDTLVTLQTKPLKSLSDMPLHIVDEYITRWSQELHGDKGSYPTRLFEGSILGVMLFPFLCWIFAVGMVTLYLSHFFTTR